MNRRKIPPEVQIRRQTRCYEQVKLQEISKINSNPHKSQVKVKGHTSQNVEFDNAQKSRFTLAFIASS